MSELEKVQARLDNLVATLGIHQESQMVQDMRWLIAEVEGSRELHDLWFAEREQVTKLERENLVLRAKVERLKEQLTARSEHVCHVGATTKP